MSEPEKTTFNTLAEALKQLDEDRLEAMTSINLFMHHCKEIIEQLINQLEEKLKEKHG